MVTSDIDSWSNEPHERCVWYVISPLQGSDMVLVLSPGRCPGLSHYAPSGLRHIGQGDAPPITGCPEGAGERRCCAAMAPSIIAPRGRHEIAQGNALGAMTHSCFRPEGAEPTSVPDQAQRGLSGHVLTNGVSRRGVLSFLTTKDTKITKGSPSESDQVRKVLCDDTVVW